MRAFLAVAAFLVSAPALAFDGVLLPSIPFSAVAVHRTGAFETREMIHYAGGRLRIDRGAGFSTTILDMNTGSQCLLMANHTYLVLPMDTALFSRYFPLKPDLSPTRTLGPKRVEGIMTTEYAFGEGGELDAAGRYWLTNSGVMVRRDYEDGVHGTNTHHVEFLTRLVFGQQDEALFEIPSGYRPAR
jgi:hypothetical protein